MNISENCAGCGAQTTAIFKIMDKSVSWFFKINFLTNSRGIRRREQQQCCFFNLAVISTRRGHASTIELMLSDLNKSISYQVLMVN